MTDFIVTLTEQTLTDGSLVYDIAIRDTVNGTAINIPAVTYQDGWDMAEKFIASISAHTLHTAEWR